MNKSAKLAQQAEAVASWTQSVEFWTREAAQYPSDPYAAFLLARAQRRLAESQAEVAR